MPAGRLSLGVEVERFAYKQPFRIAGHVFTETALVVVSLSDGEHTGRSEAAGAYYLGDDVPAMLAAIDGVRPAVEAGATRGDLQRLLPPGGARNALDCAWWALEARRSGVPVWRLAGVPEPRPLRTTITLGADAPEIMAAAARALTDVKALKLKLTGESSLDAERVAAVRAARPDCWIGVDANQGYAIAGLSALLDMLAANGVALLEQPLVRGREADLDGVERAIPIAADESALSLADTDGLVGRFDVVNIKLDKCGGLTEGLAIAARAKELGLGVMVGNMMGTSLSMAPSFVLGQLCDIVDLDGPTFLAADRSPAVEYRDGDIWCPEAVWGSAAEDTPKPD
jgi:L-alanine-DL-glutamate epimerase-like enolase superfamily enzyme